MNSKKSYQNRIRYKMRKGIVLFGLILLTSITYAQTNYSTSGNSFYGRKQATTEFDRGLLKNWYIGLNAGTTTKLGTLRGKPFSWAIGAYLGKQLNSKFDVQANFLNGKLHSEDIYGGLNLENDVNFTDASLIFKFKLNSLLFQNPPNFLNELYLIGGGGNTFYNSKVINTADNSFYSGIGWADATTKTSRENAPFIPIGMGLSFNVDKSDRFFLTAEFTYRYNINTNQLNGGINLTHPSRYIYSSVGVLYKIGTNASSSQKVIADAAKERVKPTIVKSDLVKPTKLKPTKVKPENVKPSKVNQVISETEESKNGLLSNWYAGLNAGATIMQANLREKPISWAVGAVFGKQITPKLGIQANLLNGKMHAEGIHSFNSLSYALTNDVNFTDVSLLLKLNLNDIIFNKSPKVLREFYLFGGAGYTFFNSKVINSADNTFFSGVGWADATTKTTRESPLFIPLGLGMSFNIGNTGRYFLTSEFAYRYSNDNNLDGGYTTTTGHYVYASLGLVYNFGKQTFSTQKLTADAIEEKVTSSVIKQVKGEMATMVQEELKPIKEELSNQSSTIKSIQADVKSRIDALNETIRQGVVTTKLPDGTMQATPISQAGDGAIPSIKSIYFAFNSLYLTPDMQREITLIAGMMKKNRRLKCEISGNASNVGSTDYNLILSQKRALVVAGFLSKEFGIDNNRLIIKSNGITDPLAKNLHKLNRRVDMQLFW